ncbi:MAG: DUF4922 domain-containing protein [Bacteroidales bacterium]|nr:DUF4922 domain-containing protein [Bacteroidales bacterium]
MKYFGNTVLNKAALDHLFKDQMQRWPLAKDNYAALDGVKLRSFPLDEGEKPVEIKVQYNPSRMVSSTAQIDAETIKNRKCFFCKENRPKEQSGIRYEGVTTGYTVQVNPYPIFRHHLVIQSNTHSRQELDSSRMVDMLNLAKMMPDYVVFYNGPNAGASVPDHFHFQAGDKGVLPIQASFQNYRKELIHSFGPSFKPGDCVSFSYLRVYHLTDYARGAFVIDAASIKMAILYVGKIYSILSGLTGRGDGRFDPDDIVSSDKNQFQEGGMWEPMMNVLCWWEKGFWRIAFFARGELRPSCYIAQGAEHFTISPACVEMGGLVITPVEDDYLRLQAKDVKKIFDDVSISYDIEEKLIRKMRNQPQVSVGIMHAPQIKFTLNSQYRLVEKNDVRNAKGPVYEGDLTVSLAEEDGKLLFEGQQYSELLFEPVDQMSGGTFWLRDVVIGVNFHWERKEDQMFEGCLKFIVENGAVCPINILGVEDYLTSVISSEMSATANENLLKAHAVISRSWLLAQIEHAEKEKQPSCTLKDNTEHNCPELIKWYDRDDHNNFDVCADDHCQRYQGLTRASTETVKKAIDETWGEILSYEGDICDARFYKCCGGMLEEFENAWEDTHYDYLEVVRDSEESAKTEVEARAQALKKKDPSKMKYGKNAATILDLTDEGKAEAWIFSEPDAFCNTKDAVILSQVLNNYDQETANFYRWKVEFTQEEISSLVNSKSGEDFGQIVNLIPIERGTSGRLVKLKIVGTKKTMIIGKELEIRRILSTSHLYSSAFVAKRLNAEGKYLSEELNEVPAKFELYGAGWGHGVGLCQIGAAVMGAKGYSYDSILYHYYPNAEIVKKY